MTRNANRALATVVVLFLTACAAATAATTSKPASVPQLTEGAPSTEAPISLKGAGGSKSELFSLQGGAYTVEWTVTNQSSSCFFGPDIEAVEGNAHQGVVNLVVTNPQQQGHSTLTKVSAGRYVMAVSGGCTTWSFVLSPTH